MDSRQVQHQVQAAQVEVDIGHPPASSTAEQTIQQAPPPPQEITAVVEIQAPPPPQEITTMVPQPDHHKEFTEAIGRLIALQEDILKERMKDKQNEAGWVEKQKGMLIAVATGIAVLMTDFIVNPPGGVWEANVPNNNAFCTAATPCIAGTAVSAYVQPQYFREFTKYCSVCFIISICIIFILLTGFPYFKKAIVWIYTLLMCLVLFFWTITFYSAINLLASSLVVAYGRVDIRSYYGGLLVLIWVPLIAFIVFLVKLGKAIYEKIKKPTV